MKRMTTDKDYLCVVGKPSDITSNLNKISALYDLTILTSTLSDNGTIMLVVERRKREGVQSTRPKNPLLKS